MRTSAGSGASQVSHYEEWWGPPEVQAGAGDLVRLAAEADAEIRALQAVLTAERQP